MANDRTFAGGMFFKLPTGNAPNWVKGNMSIKVEDAIKFLKENANSEGWVNLDLTESKNGKGCAFLNEYQKSNQNSGNYGSSGGSGMFSSGDNDRF